MTVLTVRHNGQSQVTNNLPDNTTFNTIKQEALSIWPEIANAEIVVNGVVVAGTATVSSVESGAELSFRLPVGSKA